MLVLNDHVKSWPSIQHRGGFGGYNDDGLPSLMKFEAQALLGMQQTVVKSAVEGMVISYSVV